MKKKFKKIVFFFLIIPFFISASAETQNQQTQETALFNTLEDGEYQLITALSEVFLTKEEQKAFQEKFAELLKDTQSTFIDKKRLREKTVLMEFRAETLKTLTEKLQDQNNTDKLESLPKEKIDQLEDTIITYLDIASIVADDLTDSNGKTLQLIDALGQKNDPKKASPLQDFYATVQKECTDYKSSVDRKEEKLEADRIAFGKVVQNVGLSFLPDPLKNLLELMNKFNFTDYEELLRLIGIKHEFDAKGNFKIKNATECFINVVKILVGKDYIKNPKWKTDSTEPKFIDAEPKLKNLRVLVESILSLSYCIDSEQTSRTGQEEPLFKFYETQIKLFVHDKEQQEKYLMSFNIIRSVLAPQEQSADGTIQKTDTQELVEKIAKKIRYFHSWIMPFTNPIVLLRTISCKITGKPNLIFYRTFKDTFADMAKTSRILKFLIKIGKGFEDPTIQSAANTTIDIFMKTARLTVRTVRAIDRTITNTLNAATEKISQATAPITIPLQDFFKGLFGTGEKTTEELDAIVTKSINEGLATNDPATQAECREKAVSAFTQRVGVSTAEGLGITTRDLANTAAELAEPAVKTARDLSSSAGKTMFDWFKKSKAGQTVKDFFFGPRAAEVLQEVGVDPENVLDAQDLNAQISTAKTEEGLEKEITKKIQATKNLAELKAVLELEVKSGEKPPFLEKVLENQLQLFKAKDEQFDENDLDFLKDLLDQSTITSILYKDANENPGSDDTFVDNNDTNDEKSTTKNDSQKQTPLDALEQTIKKAESETDRRAQKQEIGNAWKIMHNLPGGSWVKQKVTGLTETDFIFMLTNCRTTKDFYALQETIKASNLSPEAQKSIMTKSAQTLDRILKDPAEFKTFPTLRTSLQMIWTEAGAKQLTDVYDKAKEVKPADVVIQEPRVDQPRPFLPSLFKGSRDKPNEKQGHSILDHAI